MASTSPTTEPSAPTTTEIPIPTPILVTPRCILRRYHPSDVPGVAHHANNPNVAGRLRPHFPSPYTLADAEAWVKHACSLEGKCGKALSYAICDPETNTLVGSIGIRPLGADETLTVEFGYWLGEEYWGRGIMSDAASGFARWVLENFPADEVLRLEANVFSSNEASRRVVTKAGFVHEGTRRKAGVKRWDGGIVDILMFGLLREDLEGV